MLRRVLLTAELLLAAIDGYLLILLAAASRPPAKPEVGAPDAEPRVVVLVPAHDEAASIAACLDSLATAESSPHRVVVIADNCSDETPAIARACGAAVLERRDAGNRGKGHALNWALDRLDPAEDAIAFVDADCTVSPNFLSVVAAALRAGRADAVQVPYVVANPSASNATALRSAAFALMSTVRPRGRSRLGLSAGLFGTGMAFPTQLIRRYRFDPGSLVEDADLHLRLVLDGRRVQFAPAAWVRSPMPTRAHAVHSQQRRWEGGRVELLRRYARPLLARAVGSRDVSALGAAVELCVPPTSLLTFAHAVVASLSWRSGPGARRLARAALVMHVAFVGGGLRVAGAPREAYRALLAAPLLVAQKLRVLGGIAARGAPSDWERTARETAAPDRS